MMMMMMMMKLNLKAPLLRPQNASVRIMLPLKSRTKWTPCPCNCRISEWLQHFKLVYPKCLCVTWNCWRNSSVLVCSRSISATRQKQILVHGSLGQQWWRLVPTPFVTLTMLYSILWRSRWYSILPKDSHQINSDRAPARLARCV